MPGFGFEEGMDHSRGRRIWHFIFNQVPEIPEALTAGRERAYLEWFWKDIAYDPRAITERDIEIYLSAYARPGAMRAGFNWYRTVYEDAKVMREMAKTPLAMPVMAIGGESSLAQIGDVVRPLARDPKVVVMPRTGHYPQTEQPEAFTRLLLDFLR